MTSISILLNKEAPSILNHISPIVLFNLLLFSVFCTINGHYLSFDFYIPPLYFIPSFSNVLFLSTTLLSYGLQMYCFLLSCYVSISFFLFFIKILTMNYNLHFNINIKYFPQDIFKIFWIFLPYIFSTRTTSQILPLFMQVKVSDDTVLLDQTIEC